MSADKHGSGQVGKSRKLNDLLGTDARMLEFLAFLVFLVPFVIQKHSAVVLSGR